MRLDDAVGELTVERFAVQPAFTPRFGGVEQGGAGGGAADARTWWDRLQQTMRPSARRSPATDVSTIPRRGRTCPRRLRDEIARADSLDAERRFPVGSKIRTARSVAPNHMVEVQSLTARARQNADEGRLALP